MEDKKLFALIDASYDEDLSNEPSFYKKCLFKSDQDLLRGTDPKVIYKRIYKTMVTDGVVPASLPPKNRKLYQYIDDKLNDPDQIEIRNKFFGYGYVMTKHVFGPF